MKLFVATVTLAAVIALPAFAQTRQARQPELAFAQSRPAPTITSQIRPIARLRSPNPAYDVYDSQGEYVGSDPDPRVRMMLQFDPPGRNED